MKPSTTIKNIFAAGIALVLVTTMLTAVVPPRVAEATHAGGWDGWIRLSGTWSPAVSYTKSTHALSGFAWGSDVVGWLSFNGPWGNVGIDCSAPVVGDILCGTTIIVSAVSTTPPPSLSFLDFGDVTIGNTSQKIVYVHNVGSLPMTGAITFGGLNPANFTCAPTCSYTNVPSNASVPITLTYTAPSTPNVTSDAVASFTGTGVDVATLSLHGHSILPIVASALNFGTIVVTAHKDLTLTIQNTSTTDLGTVTINIPGGTPFTCVTTPCTISLPPNGSGSVTVRFAPTAVQSYSITAGLAEYPFNIPITGTGAAKVFNVREK